MMTGPRRRCLTRALRFKHLIALAVLAMALPSGMSANAAEPQSAVRQQGGNGADVYTQSGCVVCHGGLGTGGFGPKLAGNPILTISQYVVAQILIGRGQMPPFADKLSDEQIAAVAGYIRSNWGNDFGPVNTKEVADTRNLMKQAMQAASRVSQAQDLQK